MRKLSIFICAALLVLASAAGSEVAADRGWYAGFTAGQSSWGSYMDDMEGYDVERLDDSDTGWAIFGGYQISKRFGAIAGFVDLGSLTASGTDDFTSDGFTDTLDASGPFAAAQVLFPVHDRITLFANLGIFFWDMDYVWTQFGETYTGGDSGTCFMYGAGGTYWFTGKKNSGVHFEWDSFSGVGNHDVIGHEVDIDLLSVGWVYRFGK